MIIIGITGTIGAGKGAIVDYLVNKKDFKHFSVRTFLTEEIERRGMSVNRDSFHLIGDEFRQKYSPGFLVEHFLEEAEKHKTPAIIESIRSVGEVNVFKKKPRTFLVAVDAPVKVRYERILKRKSATDFVSFEKFVEQEQSESVSDEPWAMNLPRCILRADFRIENNGSIKDLHDAVDKMIATL